MVQYPVYGLKNFRCDSVTDTFYVNTFQNHLETHRFVEEPHRHNTHLLLFFTHGSGTHEVDFDRYEIKPGSLFLLQPGQLHHWNLSPDIDGFVIIYASEVYNLYFGQKRLNDFAFYASAYAKPEIILKPKEVGQIKPYFDLLLHESQRDNAFRNDKMCDLLDCIHIELARKYAQDIHQIHIYNTKINQFESLIEQHFRSQKSPSFYAGKLNITLKHLNRICNEILKKTATEVIANRVILEIKRMLADKQLSINAVAEALGFEDYSYFSRFFKKQTGMSPTDFRKYKSQT
jgi:AraC family transcriptional activator of pobA